MWTLGEDEPVIPGVPFIRWATAIPLSTAGSLRPAFAPARLVSLAVKLPYAFALYARFPTVLREPLRASVTFREPTAPVKLPTRSCSRPGLRHRVRSPEREGWYPKVGSTRARAPASQPPTYPGQHAPNSNC